MTRLPLCKLLNGLLALGLLGALNPSGAMAQGASSSSSVMERIKAAEAETANLQRAINLARNTAVSLNGGLGNYQPALCMVESRRVKECLTRRGPKGFVFRFNGGAPGWVATGQAPTVETEISIAPDGRSVLQTLYNGPLKGSAAATQQPCSCLCPVAPEPAQRTTK